MRIIAKCALLRSLSPDVLKRCCLQIQRASVHSRLQCQRQPRRIFFDYSPSGRELDIVNAHRRRRPSSMRIVSRIESSQRYLPHQSPSLSLMGTRPNIIKLPSRQEQGARSAPLQAAFPPLTHVDGEIPPELSPLDAFAAQGRLLAKQLEGTLENGRRASRLPPLMIANTLVPGRPYLRSAVSAGPPVAVAQVDPALAAVPQPQPMVQVQSPDIRPTSCYPSLSDVHRASADVEALPAITPLSDRYNPPNRPTRPEAGDIAIIPRTLSPDHFSVTTGDEQDIRDDQASIQPQTSLDSTGKASRSPTSLSNDAASLEEPHAAALTPPKPSVWRGLSSIRSVLPEHPDDDRTSHLEASTSSLPMMRKLSSGSGFSTSTPPRSPFFYLPPRSPSLNSERSLGGLRNARVRTNFSRPLSRTDRPSLDALSRQNSSDSQLPRGSCSEALPPRPSDVDVQPPVAPYADDNVPTPVSMTSDEDFDTSSENPLGPAPAYVYSRYSLPRGRILHRDPGVLHDDPRERHRFQWELPSGPPDGHVATIAHYPVQRPPSPPSPPPLANGIASSPNQSQSEGLAIRGLVRSASVTPDAPRSRLPETSPRHRGGTSPVPSPVVVPPSDRAGTPSAPVPHLQYPVPTDARDPSAEEHLNKGIECHEQGSLKESTYHLRIAARANHPTAMLLYALACRHGWGMRPNPREGVQWLRRAADLVSLEVADEEGRGLSAPADILETKTRRAQFALSIYELGVSHMNGWGIEQDKALALRCFEIAGGSRFPLPTWARIDLFLTSVSV